MGNKKKWFWECRKQDFNRFSLLTTDSCCLWLFSAKTFKVIANCCYILGLNIVKKKLIYFAVFAPLLKTGFLVRRTMPIFLWLSSHCICNVLKKLFLVCLLSLCDPEIKTIICHLFCAAITLIMLPLKFDCVLKKFVWTI